MHDDGGRIARIGTVGEGINVLGFE